MFIRIFWKSFLKSEYDSMDFECMYNVTYDIGIPNIEQLIKNMLCTHYDKQTTADKYHLAMWYRFFLSFFFL